MLVADGHLTGWSTEVSTKHNSKKSVITIMKKEDFYNLEPPRIVILD